MNQIRATDSVAASDQLPLTPWRIPHATYRLQLSPAFTFRDAQALIDYLYDLVSDCYASLIFQARAGSTHDDQFVTSIKRV